MKCLRAAYGRGEGLKSDEEIIKELKIPSLQQQIDYFDLMSISKVIFTRKPAHLAKFIEKTSTRTRGSEEGNVRLNFIAKSKKLKDSFLPRSVKKFNKLPRELKQITTLVGLSTKVKRFIQGLVSIDEDQGEQ